MKSLARLGVENPVVAGIVKIAILAGGVYGALTLVRDMFPESRPNRVLISVAYPGATPAEIERGLALRIEEAVRDVEHVDRIRTDISEGLCLITLEMSNDVDDIDQAVDDVKAAIDTIPREDLPEDAEEIRVRKLEPRLPVISATVFGDADEPTLKHLGEELREDLLRMAGISDVLLEGTREPVLRIEAEPERLIAYHTPLSEVAAAIRRSNLDLPGGEIRTAHQNISVRTLGETLEAERIAETILRTTPDGRAIRVRDIGRVIDGFDDSTAGGRFNGKPAVNVTVYKTASQDAIRISRLVRAYVAGKSHQPFAWTWQDRLAALVGKTSEAKRVYDEAWREPCPPNLHIMTHSNLARFIEGRLELLERNGLWGLFLVFTSLMLFLNWRVAFWVMVGLVVAVAGTIILMKAWGLTLNLISMFGLIVVLGLIVDDGIVVAENTFSRIEAGDDPTTAAIEGCREVAWPVIIAVATTIAAFLPLLFIQGQIGDFMGVLPVVVSFALSVSLLEALYMLPAHLAETLRPQDRTARPPTDRVRWWMRRLRSAETHVLMDPLRRAYAALLHTCVHYRYVTVAAIVACMLVVLGLTPLGGGHLKFVFIQKMDSETIMADLTMPVGTPIEHTKQTMARIEQAALGIPEVRTVWTIFGAQLQADEMGIYPTFRSHLAQAVIELAPVEQRDRSSDQIIAELRKKTADLVGIDALTFRAMHGGPAGREIEAEVSGPRIADILAVAGALKQKLNTYRGVYDIADDYERGAREVQLELLDSARPLGIDTRYLATELRGAFYGLKARTIQRGRDDVEIRVRYPEHRRRNLYELEQMRIVLPDGRVVPLSEVARIKEAISTSAIRRVDQHRAVTVYADVDQSEGNANEILADLRPFIDKQQFEHPGVRVRFTGNRRETLKALGSLKRDFLIAVAVIYCMLAGLFRSYLQPLVVLTSVPFGLIGAVLGHLLMGYPLTILSAIGLVALTGIVVNDALILVDFINKQRAAGVPRVEAVIAGGVRRLRPIILTSLTTVLGLAPLMAEQSFQARFLIPMAISISFGLAFATVLTLLLVPASYLILEDLITLARRLWYGPEQPEPAPAAGA